MTKIDEAMKDAADTVAAMIVKHRQAAIPAILAQCVAWAVDHGGSKVIRGSLKRAIKLADEIEAERTQAAN